MTSPRVTRPGIGDRWHRGSLGIIAVLLLALPGSVSGQAAPQPAARFRVESAFWWGVLRRSWVGPDSEPRDNDHGEFAWPISYRMEAIARYLSVVETDSAAWELLRRDVRATLAARDSDRGLTDYRGRSRPVWSATAYSDPVGVRASWLDHTASIAGGLAAAGWELRRGDKPDQALGDSAIAAAWLAMQAFDEDRHSDPQSHGSYYVFPSDFPIREAERGRELPHNQLAAAGRAWWWLGRASGSAGAQRIAAELATFIVSRASIKDSALVWSYQQGSVVDDVAHGSEVAAFLMTVPPETSVDGVPIRRALAGTLRAMFRLHGDSIEIADHVDGGTTGGARYRGAFGQWAELVPYACDMYGIVARGLWEFPGKHGAQGIIGATALIEAERTCPGPKGILRALVTTR